MYERFTDRARKVMQLANQEAQRFNHEYIGTEHILLGLLKEGQNIAVQVLVNLGINRDTLRDEVVILVQKGPDMVTMGRLPQTPRAKRVVEYAIEEAKQLNHQHVGTEHMLLGLLRENEGIAAQVLTKSGVSLEKIREECLRVMADPAELAKMPKMHNLLTVLAKLKVYMAGLEHLQWEAKKVVDEILESVPERDAAAFKAQVDQIIEEELKKD